MYSVLSEKKALVSPEYKPNKLA